MTKKWHHKTGMTKKCKTKWQKNDQKMTKINNQQPSEFAGKIFIRLHHVTSTFFGGRWNPELWHVVSICFNTMVFATFCYPAILCIGYIFSCICYHLYS